MKRLSFQSNHCNFRLYTDTQRRTCAAETGVDVEVAGAVLVEACVLVVLPCRWRPAEDAELHVVRMSAKGEVDVGAREDFATPVGRIVGEKDGEKIVCSVESSDGAHGIFEVAIDRERWLANILYTDEGDGVFAFLYVCTIATIEEGCGVIEHLPACLFLHELQAIDILLASLVIVAAHIVGIVVIAHDAIDWDTRGRETCKLVAERYGFCGPHCDKIACKDNEVRLLGEDGIDDLRHECAAVFIEQGSQMPVRDMCDAVAVERGRDALGRNRDFIDLDTQTGDVMADKIACDQDNHDSDERPQADGLCELLLKEETDDTVVELIDDQSYYQQYNDEETPEDESLQG